MRNREPASFLFLGTGASAGIPVLGCSCITCTSSHAKNKRLRSSLLLQANGKKFLFDSGPDFRQQALHAHLTTIDAHLLTHTHYDHIAGIDDLRVLAALQKKPLPTFLSEESYEILKIRYAYLFGIKATPSLIARTQLIFHPLLEPHGSFFIDDLSFSYFHYFQKEMKVTGYRLGTFAYVTDIRTYDSSIFQWLSGVRYLVISALHKEPSHVHFSLQEAADFATQSGAEMSWITHISHHLDHEEASMLLPPNVRMGYDGLSVSLGTV